MAHNLYGKPVFAKEMGERLAKIDNAILNVEEQVKGVFNKYKFTVNLRSKIVEVLKEAIRDKSHEEEILTYKHDTRPVLNTDFDKLQKKINKLIDSTNDSPDLSLTHKNKKLSKEAIDQVVSINKIKHMVFKYTKDVTAKRTLEKVAVNPKILKAYTVLIKKLVKLINATFLEDGYYWIEKKPEGKGHIKQKTYVVVAVLINSVFTNLKFSPAQIKSRYHK